MDDAEELVVHEAATGGGAGLRLFVALHVPTDLAERLADHADAVATALDAGRVTDPSTMHVSWAFPGTVTEDYVPVVARALEVAAMEVPGATLCTLGQTTVFGRGRAFGVEVDVELLAPLDAARDRFLDTIAPYAPAADRRAWRPHVTILRSRKVPLSPSRLAAAPQAPVDSWIATELRLYASLPGPDGRQHRLLHSVPFGSHVRQG